MEIRKIAVEVVDGGKLVTATGFVPEGAKLEGEDLVALTQALADAQSIGKPAEEKPTRRGRPAKDDTAQEPPKDETPRRRRNVEDAKPKGPTDEDLSKAASEAAEVLGKDHVLGLLKEELGVEKVSEIDSVEDREKFLRWLREDIEKAKAAKPSRRRS